MIGHFGRAHTPLAAKGFEFAQGTAKGSGIRATREEEIELIAGCRDTLAPQGDIFDGGPGWLLGQGEGDDAQENAEVEGGEAEHAVVDISDEQSVPTERGQAQTVSPTPDGVTSVELDAIEPSDEAIELRKPNVISAG